MRHPEGPRMHQSMVPMKNVSVGMQNSPTLCEREFSVYEIPKGICISYGPHIPMWMWTLLLSSLIDLLFMNVPTVFPSPAHL
jgi:hypothetical protein